MKLCEKRSKVGPGTWPSHAGVSLPAKALFACKDTSKDGLSSLKVGPPTAGLKRLQQVHGNAPGSEPRTSPWSASDDPQNNHSCCGSGDGNPDLLLGAGLLLSGQPSYLSLQMTGVSKVCEYMRTPAVSKVSLHGPATSQVPRGGAGGQVRDNFSVVKAAAPLLEATPARLVFPGPPGWPWLSAPCPAPRSFHKGYTSAHSQGAGFSLLLDVASSTIS